MAVVEKQVFFSWIRMPCINGTIGTCFHSDICSMTPNFFTCPVRMGSMEKIVSLKLPDMSGTLPLTGNYKFTIRPYKAGVELGCIYGGLSIKAVTVHDPDGEK